MELFLYYLLRASVLMALFYVCYRLFFANNTFHNVNRFSLIIMMLTVVILPLFRFNLIPEKKTEPVIGMFPPDFSFFPITELVETQPRIAIPWVQILMILFVAGFLFTLIRYLTGLSQMAVIIRKSEKQMLVGHTVLCITDRNISPFSWMKYIVLSRKDLSADNRAVIRHEKAHIHLRHSFDMIFFDIFTCIFWFNPFSWLLRREIQSVHEYQADEQVLNHGIDTKQYQLLLIRKSVGEYKFALANNFRQRDLHKRIIMMKRNKTNRRMKWNYVMALPVLFLAMIALSVPKLNAGIPEKESNDTVKKETAFSIHVKDSVIVTGRVDLNEHRLALEKTKIVPKDSTLTTGSGENVNISIRGYRGNPLVIMDEKKITETEFKKIKAEDIASISILKDASAVAVYGDEGNDGVILITTKRSNRDVKTIGSGSMDSLRGDVRDLIEEIDKRSSQVSNQLSVKVRSQSLNEILENPPLIIVDGEKMPKDFDLNSISSSDIESISVLKDKSATEIYGDEGKNGVIIITKKSPDQKP